VTDIRVWIVMQSNYTSIIKTNIHEALHFGFTVEGFCGE